MIRSERNLCPYLLFIPTALILCSCLPVQMSQKSSGGGSPSVLAGAGFGGLPAAANPNVLAGHAENGSIDGGSAGGGYDGGTLNGGSLSCDTTSAVLQVGQSLTLNCHGGGGSPSFTLGSPDAPPGSDIGQLVPVAGGGVTYTAPPSVTQGITIEITVEAGTTDGGTITVPIQIVPPGEIGVIDDGTTRGAVGNVFQVEPNTPQIPDLSLYVPVQTVVTPNLDIPNHDFSQGFPGVRDLVEWFCIRFDGRLSFPTDGVYQFDLTADDGAIFYLDDTLLVNNDGIHSVSTAHGTSYVSAGMHRFRVDYYQGPRYYIALQLLWKKPGDTKLAIIPPDNFYRP